MFLDTMLEIKISMSKTFNSTLWQFLF